MGRNDQRASGPRAIAAVILTTSREERDLGNEYQLGVNAYIQKPVDFDQFRSVVKEVGLFWLVVNQPPPPAALRPK
jgi:DNA-binding NarL/FixJ family response regulator